jgi:hypothetical protein
MMPKMQLPPHLVSVLGKKQCSLCKLVFDEEVEPSLGAAFRAHVLHFHSKAAPSAEFSVTPNDEVWSPKVVSADVCKDGVILEFQDGKTASFLSATLYAALPQAVRVIESREIEDDDA